MSVVPPKEREHLAFGKILSHGATHVGSDNKFILVVVQAVVWNLLHSIEMLDTTVGLS
jgi:hypothetical protein